MENWNSDNDDKNNQEYQNVYYDSYFSNNENEIRVLKKKNKRKIYIIIYLIIGFVSVLIVMCVWSLKSNKMDFSDVLSQKIENNDIKPQESLKIPENLDAPQGLPVSEVYEKCLKSVVGVFVTREGFSIFSDPMKQQVLGSGIIVKSNGYILTNAHVVEGCDQNSDISVTFSDKPGNKIKAKLIGRDRRTDIAIIKIDKNDLEAIPFGDSSKLKIGDQVYAIGSPSGLPGTITFGRISYLNRRVYDDVWSTNFIQLTAPINPGNSGGALVDSSGRLVGVNTLKTENTEGIGFAIPVNDAVKIADDLINHGKVLRPAIGVTVNDKLVIERISDESELRGKVSCGDTITEINDIVVKTPIELVAEIRMHSIGDNVDVSVQTALLKKVVSVKLRELK